MNQNTVMGSLLAHLEPTPINGRLLALILTVVTTHAIAETTVLSGATVYDGNGDTAVRNAVIHIKDHKIACIGSQADCPAPEGAKVIDLTGQYVTPGLVDAHVHFSQTGWLDGRPDARIGLNLYDYDALQESLRTNPDRWHRAYLCTGITAVFDVGGFTWTLDYEQDAESHPERAHVRAAGPLVTHASSRFNAEGEDKFLPMSSDEEAISSVRKLAELGARAVKVWYLNPPPGQQKILDQRLLAIGREADSLGLPLIVHSTELRNAKAAVRAGADMLVHSVQDQPVDDEFLRLAKQADTVYAPTLLVSRNWRRAVASAAVGQPHPIDDPNGCVDQETRNRLQDAGKLQTTLPAAARNLNRVFTSLESGAQRDIIMMDNLIKVYEAGIPIATATDAGNPLTIHGPSIYEEMEVMQQAGIPAKDVLVMSTRNGAAIMNGLDRFGTLEKGKAADLIILAEDPGQQTSAFRSITHVMRHGSLKPIEYFSEQN